MALARPSEVEEKTVNHLHCYTQAPSAVLQLASPGFLALAFTCSEAYPSGARTIWTVRSPAPSTPIPAYVALPGTDCQTELFEVAPIIMLLPKLPELSLRGKAPMCGHCTAKKHARRLPRAKASS
ncbi:hypothetical protein C8Q76DRAFT_741229, partial [Earliella scabrosa]